MEQRLGGGEEGSHLGIWGQSGPGRRTARAMGSGGGVWAIGFSSEWNGRHGRIVSRRLESADRVSQGHSGCC